MNCRAASAEEKCGPEPNLETLAFLQYTSGSTAAPRGVMVTHGNLLHNLACLREVFGFSSESVGVTWLPHYHDMGLIGGLLQPVFAGGEMVVMPPSSFLQRPIRWLAAVTRYRATTMVAPNFAYELCGEKISAEQRATLDLTSVKVALCGAEPVRRDTLAHFAKAFGPCGFRREAFRPAYGLAEATLIVSGRSDGGAPCRARRASRGLEAKSNHVRGRGCCGQPQCSWDAVELRRVSRLRSSIPKLFCRVPPIASAKSGFPGRAWREAIGASRKTRRNIRRASCQRRRPIPSFRRSRLSRSGRALRYGTIERSHRDSWLQPLPSGFGIHRGAQPSRAAARFGRCVFRRGRWSGALSHRSGSEEPRVHPERRSCRRDPPCPRRVARSSPRCPRADRAAQHPQNFQRKNSALRLPRGISFRHA